MTLVDKLYEVGSKLPPPALAELLDFAEFLRQKHMPAQSAHGLSLAELKGGLEDSTTFAQPPVNIQEMFKHHAPD